MAYRRGSRRHVLTLSRLRIASAQDPSALPQRANPTIAVTRLIPFDKHSVGGISAVGAHRSPCGSRMSLADDAPAYVEQRSVLRHYRVYLAGLDDTGPGLLDRSGRSHRLGGHPEEQHFTASRNPQPGMVVCRTIALKIVTDRVHSCGSCDGSTQLTATRSSVPAAPGAAVHSPRQGFGSVLDDVHLRHHGTRFPVPGSHMQSFGPYPRPYSYAHGTPADNANFYADLVKNSAVGPRHVLSRELVLWQMGSAPQTPQNASLL